MLCYFGGVFSLDTLQSKDTGFSQQKSPCVEHLVFDEMFFSRLELGGQPGAEGTVLGGDGPAARGSGSFPPLPHLQPKRRIEPRHACLVGMGRANCSPLPPGQPGHQVPHLHHPKHIGAFPILARTLLPCKLHGHRVIPVLVLCTTHAHVLPLC